MFYLRLCFSNVHRPLCFLVLEASFGHGLAAAAAFQISLFGAENETRTRDPDLGKVVLYQLSYFRIAFFTTSKCSKTAAKVQTFLKPTKLFLLFRDNFFDLIELKERF